MKNESVRRVNALVILLLGVHDVETKLLIELFSVIITHLDMAMGVNM